MSWKVFLKNGEVITNPEFYQALHGNNYWSFKKRIVLSKKVVLGHLWWKKELEEIDEHLETLLVIPIGNILKIEQIEE